MISLLIVDDEAAIRNAINEMLTNRYKDIFQIYQAENGLKAVEIVCSVPVDIIITDIKMPVYTGLEMLAKLKELNYSVLSIVVSGFDDYALVREAMKSGAADYLLKPIETVEFFNIIDSCLLSISSSHTLQKQSKVHIETVEETLFHNQYALSRLLESDITKECEQILRDYRLDGHSPCIIAILDIFQMTLQKSSLKKAWACEIDDELSKLLPRGGYTLIQGEQTELWTILFFYHTEEARNVFIQYMDQLLQKKIKICLSDPCVSLTLQTNFLNCIQNLAMYFFDIPKVCIQIPEEYPYPSLTKSILDAIWQLDFKSFCEHLQKWFYLICERKPPVQEVKQALCGLIYSAMQRNNVYIRIIGTYKFTENDIIEAIQTAFSAEYLRKEMIRIIDIYMEEAAFNISQRDDFYIQKAKKYIGEHFTEEITLVSISAHLSIHPNYFSTLFKKRTGLPYTQYLRQVRIDEACRLIKNTNKKFYEIAEAVGFHDTIQFNRAFKQETGQSPSSYKRKLDINP